jgi:histone H2B
MMSDMFERLVDEATKLMAKDKNRTLGARELAAAVKLHFTGDLRAHAMSEGAKAVTKARE